MTSGDEENFSNLVETTRVDLENLRNSKGLMDGSEYIFAEYIKKLNRKPCCPLCDRNFDQESDVRTLLNKVSFWNGNFHY